MDSRILFIGGDKRTIYAAEAVSQRFEVHTLGLSDGSPAPIGKYGTVVLPLPFSRDGKSITAPFSDTALPLSLAGEYVQQGGLVLSGMSSPTLADICVNSGARLSDYFADESLTLKNAALTAEAALSILVQNTDCSLCGAAVLITGGGRIAMITARLLRCLGAEVTICARSAEQRTKASLEYHRSAELRELSALCEGADIIINTPPARLFSQGDFARMKKDALYMELASLPPEPYSEFAAHYGVKYIHAAGLPGKYSPKTAGEAIAEVIIRRLSE